MASIVYEPQSTAVPRGGWSSSMARRRRVFKILATVFLVTYSAATIFPFYVLFIRTFVSTKESSTLHFWVPRQEEITMEAQIGNLAVFHNLDIRQVKKDLGIKDYVAPRDTLREIAEKHNIPIEEMRRYFSKYGVLSGWITLTSGGEFWSALARSLIVVVCSLAVICFLSILTGCGLAGLRERYQTTIYNLYLLEMVIPAMLIIVPQFVLVQRLQGLIPGTGVPGPARWAAQILSVICIFIKGGAFSTMIFTAAITAVPRELEESSQIDGANRWQYIRHILLPLLKVPIATVIVILLPDFWNRFLEPYVYLDLANTTVLPLIQGFAGKYSSNFQVIFTGVFISLLPLLVVYLIFRRWFIQGVMSGAVKG
jgi:ABC-type glycerol-3-phosphate transport system permease component